MRDEKKKQIAAVAGFLGLLVLPGLLWLPLKGLADTASYENRTLAAFPGADTPVSEWPDAFEDWLGDHAPFRNGFLSLKAGLDALTGSLDSSDVLLGEDGWLFLKDVSDSSSLSDYQGLTSFSGEEMASITEKTEKLSGLLEEKGSRLVLLFAPAKERVYADKMPESIPIVRQETRVGLLTAYLGQNTGVPVLFPQQLLSEAAQEQQVYYKYDTHWNNAGAWLAAQQVLDTLGLPSQDGLPAVSADGTRAAPTDLANMCGRWKLCRDDVYLVPEGKAAAEYLRDSDEFTGYAGDGEQYALLVRDSFGEMLAPWLAQGFKRTLVVHNNLMTPEFLAEQVTSLPDVVVVETAERFIDTLPSRLDRLTEWAEGLE